MLLKAVRATGWTLIGIGVLIGLYLVYLLFFTSLEADRAQQDLLEEWELNVGPVDSALPAEPLDEDPDATAEPVDAGSAYAVMWFERPGSDERPVNADDLYIVEGTALSLLRSGPGHYTETSAPGAPGNFAIAGHRTTYSAPFYHLDRAEPGDLIHVIDRSGRKFTYEVRELEVVGPRAFWVIGEDPLGTGNPTMTLTTCHPRFSAAQRLVLFAELVEG